MTDIIRRKERRGTDAEWTSTNEVLAEGEIGFAKDSQYFKFGDGLTAWNSLAAKYEAAINGVYRLRNAGQLSGALSFLATGGMLDFPRGILQTGGDLAPASANVWQGRGANFYDTTIGTVLQLTANSKPIIKIDGGKSNFYLADVALDMIGRTGATGVEIKKGTGAGANPTFHLVFHRLTFHEGQFGINIDDPAHGWQVTGVSVIDCNFHLQTEACIRVDTVNQRLLILGCSFTPTGNGTADAIALKYSATTLIANNTFNGFDISNPKTLDFDFATTDVNTTDNKVTKASTSAVTGDPCYIVSTGTIPGGLSLVQRYFIRKSGNDHYFHLTPREAINALNTVDITSTGSGTHTCRLISRVKTTGRPRACISTQGQNGMMSLINNEAESLAYFLYLNGNDDMSKPLMLVNNLVQAAVQFNSSYSMISIGNNYPARSFLDQLGVHSKVQSIGDKIWTPDGLGATYYDLGGTVTPPYPWHLSNFIGDSEIDVERELSFVPSDLDECVCLLESDFYYAADGTNITTNWGDPSKRKSTVTITGTPTMELNELNGLQVLRLGADSNDTINLPDLSGYRWYHGFLVSKITTFNDSGHTWGTASENDHYIYGDGNNYATFATTARKNAGAPTTGVDSWHVSEYCSGPNYWAWWMNNTLEYETTTNTVGWPTAAKLGVNGATTYMKADLASFILLVGNRRLETQKVRKIRDYIKDKWGVG